MRAVCAVACALVMGGASWAAAAPITLMYAVSGVGGVAGPVAGFSDASFWWADSTGLAAGSTLAPFGFETYPFIAQNGSVYTGTNTGTGETSPFASDILRAQSQGSYLLSTPFTLDAGDVLTTDFSLIQNREFNITMVGFAMLLEGGAIDAILGVTRPDGFNNFTDLTHPTSLNFPVQSDGVTASVTKEGLPPPMVLGSTQYGLHVLAGDCFEGANHPCETDVDLSYAPGAGTYQLLFGMFSIAPRFDPVTAAFAVKSVDVTEVTEVPEPSSLSLLTAGLFATCLVGRHRRR
jgi:hypothetical protein